jgi:hypothetical protein
MGFVESCSVRHGGPTTVTARTKINAFEAAIHHLIT